MRRIRRISKTRRFLEALLLIAGLTGVGIWGWSHVRLALFQHQANRVLERKAAIRPPNHAAPPPPLRNGALLGRLVIPRLKMGAVVREGAGEDTLDVALGHIPGTALPGQAGNVGVAGHRDTLFRGLRNIAKDDVIRIETPTGSYNYQVESTGIVKPKDVGVLSASKNPELTLVTCYPFYYVGPAPNRFIVKARLESAPVAVNAPKHLAAVLPPHPVTPRAPAASPASRKPLARRVSFELRNNQTRELAPGVRMSLSRTDPVRQRASGSIWVTPESHTIWLRDLAANRPLLFQRRELVLTQVSENSVSGYLLLFQ